MKRIKVAGCVRLTILYEFKTGPYLGVELDKKFIKDKSLTQEEYCLKNNIDPYLQTK